jgi:hypothetical protein
VIINSMERHVTAAYDRLRSMVPEFTDSPRHRDDVIVYALNRLPPRYVVTNEGQAVTEVALETPQQRAPIDVQVLDAMRHVASRPREPSGRER